MAFVAVATTVGTTVGLTGVGATLAGGAILGAGAGGLYSAITKDGDILNSMLTGGLIGGAVGGIGGALFPGAAGLTPAGGAVAPGAVATAPSTAAVPTANVMTSTPALQAAASNAANLEAAALAEGSTVAGMVPAANTGLAANTVLPANMTFTQPVAQAAGKSLGKQMLGYGLAGTAAMQLLGNKPTVGAGPAPYPGDVRPYEYASRPVGMEDGSPSPYPTAQYDVAGNPILDTSERTYFDQGFTAYQPYRAGTSNPNIPLSVKTAADGGLMAAYPMNKYTPGLPNVETYTMGLAEGGDVDSEFEKRRQKELMKTVKGSSTKDLEKMLGAMNEQEFLRRNMPAYAESMRPSISGMVESAQYGDRMAQAYGGQPRDINIMPTVVDPTTKTYGGIASIGQQIDPQTRMNLMADIQSTPYDRNRMDMIRRVGAGIDRQVGRDANISAFYEQDPMGRNKMGGARFTQRFNEGGETNRLTGMGGFFARALQEAGIPSIFDRPGLPPINQTPGYTYDAANQRYMPSEAQVMAQRYSYDPSTQTYQTMAKGGQISNLGSFSDGGRMLKGPGDGMSDDIPGVIGGKQPARLADGEFVVPADVVSHLGNGSTDAGAKRLYAMMDRVRKARTGTKKQGKQIKAEKYLPK